MQEPNEIEQMFIDAINTDVIDEMEESQLRALLTVLAVSYTHLRAHET